MKNNIFVLLFCAGLAQSSALAQHHVDYIATDELAQSVKVPSQVLELVARPKSQKPTWAVLEMNGEPTGVYGQLREVSRGAKGYHVCSRHGHSGPAEQGLPDEKGYPIQQPFAKARVCDLGT